MSVVCDMCVMSCYVMCYVLKTLDKKELVTMSNRITILGIDPKFGLSIQAHHMVRKLLDDWSLTGMRQVPG